MEIAGLNHRFLLIFWIGLPILQFASGASKILADDQERENFLYRAGAIVRGDATRKTVALIFSGDRYADGGNHILRVLKDTRVHASFFFTGNFYRNPDYSPLIRKLITGGHYLGAHSDRHLLYCSWQKRDSLLLSQSQFNNDLKANYQAMKTFGISPEQASYYLPPYEWYNDTIAARTKALGLTLINFTGGTCSNADYTTPNMGERYISSREILEYEQSHKDGLNSFLLLMHVGTHPDRRDKLYHLLEPLILRLRERGYRFERVDRLLKYCR